MIPYQAWRVVEMNLFTKNIRGFVDFGKQAEPKNQGVLRRLAWQGGGTGTPYAKSLKGSPTPIAQIAPVVE